MTYFETLDCIEQTRGLHSVAVFDIHDNLREQEREGHFCQHDMDDLAARERDLWNALNNLTANLAVLATA